MSDVCAHDDDNMQAMVEVCEYHEDTVRERRSTLLRSPDNDGELIVPFDNEPAGSATSTKKMCPNIPFAYIQAAATVVVGFGLFVIPFVPVDLMNTKAEQRLIGILLAVVTSWLFSLAPIPLTALMVGPLCVVYGVTTAEEAFRYYADPLLFLFYGAFFIAAAMSRHGLDSRLARRLTENQFVNDIPWRLRLCSMVCGAFMSMWISNTATTAILLPIIMGTFSNREHPRSDTISRAEAIIVGGLGTLIGTPPNLIATRLLAAEGYKIDFVAWLQVGLPCTVGLVLLIFVITTGLALTLGRGFVKATGVTGLWTVTGVFTVFTCFFTEICSNTASTNILIPLVIGICSELNISPVPPCVGVALAASCAFMMPIATGPNAIAFKTALVPLPVMVKTGLVVNVAASIYLLALLRGLMPAYGWDELATNTTREIFD
eukprot:gene11568-17818_t